MAIKTERFWAFADNDRIVPEAGIVGAHITKEQVLSLMSLRDGLPPGSRPVLVTVNWDPEGEG